MKHQSNKTSSDKLQTVNDVKDSLNNTVMENPAIERALRRLKESKVNDNHVSHYTKHSSHAVKHSSTW